MTRGDSKLGLTGRGGHQLPDRLPGEPCPCCASAGRPAPQRVRGRPARLPQVLGAHEGDRLHRPARDDRGRPRPTCAIPPTRAPGRLFLCYWIRSRGRRRKGLLFHEEEAAAPSLVADDDVGPSVAGHVAERDGPRGRDLGTDGHAGREAPMAIAGVDVALASVSMGDHDVGLRVSVEVRDGDRRRGIGRETGAGRKAPRAVVQTNVVRTGPARAPVRDDYVGTSPPLHAVLQRRVLLPNAHGPADGAHARGVGVGHGPGPIRAGGLRLVARSNEPFHLQVHERRHRP